MHQTPCGRLLRLVQTVPIVPKHSCLEQASTTHISCLMYRSYMLMQVDTQRSKQWSSVIEASVQLLQQQLALHPETGLLADFLVYNKSEKRYKPSKGKILERDSDGDFGYNACRFV